MASRPPSAGSTRNLSTNEIDDGWVLPDEGAMAKPLLVTEKAPVNGTASAAPDGWSLNAEPARNYLDLNAATADELVELPGIGARKARTIVQHRESRGPFQSVDELEQLHGFGPKLVKALADHVRV